MGPHHSSATSPDFNPKQWQITDQQASQNQLKGIFIFTSGNYKVLQNIHTGQLIDQYQLFWPSQQQFRFYLDSYLWRRQEYNIVASRFLVEQHSQKFCSRSYSAKVYIEHIPTRLSDVTDIPFPDNLYVGLAVMDGYQKLYQNVHHYFPVSQDQICVDRQGVVKVWVNSDLSKNYPQPENELSDNKDESNMVDELLNLLWQNTDQESEPNSFKQTFYLRRQFYVKKKGKKRVGFDEAKVFINEYAKFVSCQIPQRFNSILQMIDESDDYQNTNHQQGDEHHDGQDLQGQQHYDEEVPYDNDHQQGLYEDEPHEDQYHTQYVGHLPHQKVIYEPIIYNREPIQTFSSPIPSPVVINPPFIPRQVTPSNGHIITIPPIPGRYSLYPTTFINLQNSSGYKSTFKVQQQKSQKIQKVVNQQQREQDLRLQQFSNKNQGFQKHVSMLNPPEGQDYQEEKREENYQREKTDGMGQFSNRKEINYPVGRSLPLTNQSHQQSLRTNKSQIDAQQQSYQIPYNKISYNQQDYNQNQKYVRLNENQKGFNIEEPTYQNDFQNSLQTKYYTLDTEVDLDEEIAADLRKMIRAG